MTKGRKKLADSRPDAAKYPERGACRIARNVRWGTSLQASGCSTEHIPQWLGVIRTESFRTRALREGHQGFLQRYNRYQGIEKMYHILRRTFIIVLAAFVITACGGGGGREDLKTSGGGTGGSGSGGGSTGGGSTTGTVTITLQSSLTQLSAGGSTSLTATLTDAQSGLFLTATDVTFSSVCIGSNLASVISPITSNSGVAITTYTAQGCTGNDVITASATVDGSTISANVTVNVLAATLGSIEFVSSVPNNIALKGMGGAGQSETSAVTFRVLDTAGNPIGNRSVTFTLNTTVGGLQFSPGTGTATSGSDGLIQTIVQSGTVATPVRVTATVDSTGIATQSDQLVVTTGIPDNNSFSLAAETLNPEAWDTDGVQVPITARLADRFNNPVPDGTTILFTTEGGSIGGSCQTVTGACSVNWVSQNPRPSDGRVTILATAVGEESFTDQNGNGSFDAGEPFNDLGEAFQDNNEDGAYQIGEQFADFNVNGSRDIGDGTYNGVVCSASSCVVSTLNVRDSVTIVMSGKFANITIASGATTVALPATINIVVVDDRGQIMPAGTTIKATTSNGTIDTPSTFTVTNTSANCAGACTYSFGLSKDTTPSSGAMTVTVTTPGGTVKFSSITVTDLL
ncbi:MAG: hypothetical protein GXP23_09775 [Gammaproteobacteria bacterium]|nr:hypothetical protein [Gammaproteobacteria bacterium]